MTCRRPPTEDDTRRAVTRPVSTLGPDADRLAYGLRLARFGTPTRTAAAQLGADELTLSKAWFGTPGPVLCAGLVEFDVVTEPRPDSDQRPPSARAHFSQGKALHGCDRVQTGVCRAKAATSHTEFGPMAQGAQ